MMLFAQELDRKMNQRIQEADQRVNFADQKSNATLLQTMAFIANNK